MSEAPLFISSCTRRDLHRRRRGSGRLGAVARLGVVLMCLGVGIGAFLAGHGGL